MPFVQSQGRECEDASTPEGLSDERTASTESKMHLSWEVLEGDVRSVLPTLPAESVQTVVTSPPYWGLRDFETGPDALGLEPTPDLYVEHLVEVFREVKRVLRKDGTLWLNMGDSYAANTGALYPEAAVGKGKRANRPNAWSGITATPVKHPTKPKDLVGMPWRVAFALQADGWWLRSEIIWSKPNPMPESVTDRPTRAHEQVFLLTKSARYFYDADAVREPHAQPWRSGSGERFTTGNRRDAQRDGDGVAGWWGGEREYNPSGRNLRSVWNIPTEPFPEAHFATFPKKLVEPCVKAGTSEKGCCPECGASWVRVVDVQFIKLADRRPTRKAVQPGADMADVNSANQMGYNDVKTVGWQPSCTHALNPISCTVLDPFCGSGTVGVVARGFGRRFIGIELNPKYAEMARRRISGTKRGLDEDGTPLWEQETMFS